MKVFDEITNNLEMQSCQLLESCNLSAFQIVISSHYKKTCKL